MRGLDRMRSMPLDSAAERRTREVDGVVDRAEGETDRAAGSGADRGRQVDGEVRVVRPLRVNGLRPAVGVLASLAPPTTPTEFGNARPVGLPVAAENVASPPHWMPTSRR